MSHLDPSSKSTRLQHGAICPDYSTLGGGCVQDLTTAIVMTRQPRPVELMRGTLEFAPLLIATIAQLRGWERI